MTTRHLHQAATRYPDAVNEIAAWHAVVTGALWTNFVEVRPTFADADAVDGYVIFNVRRNRDRLVTVVHDAGQYQGTALASPAEMIRLGAPHVIHKDDELAEYTRALFQLTAKRTAEEMDAIELLTMLIERYEGEEYALPKAEPLELLRYLMERNGLSQRDLIAEFGVESTVSLVLSGKRQMNRNHIARLSARFGVSPGVFLSVKLLQDMK